jgi:hypothetical protein
MEQTHPTMLLHAHTHTHTYTHTQRERERELKLTYFTSSMEYRNKYQGKLCKVMVIWLLTHLGLWIKVYLCHSTSIFLPMSNLSDSVEQEKEDQLFRYSNRPWLKDYVSGFETLRNFVRTILGSLCSSWNCPNSMLFYKIHFWKKYGMSIILKLCSMQKVSQLRDT